MHQITPSINPDADFAAWDAACSDAQSAAEWEAEQREATKQAFLKRPDLDTFWLRLDLGGPGMDDLARYVFAQAAAGEPGAVLLMDAIGDQVARFAEIESPDAFAEPDYFEGV